MSKRQYRSDLGIISEILSVTMDSGRSGIIISAISRRTNLSHNVAIEKCQRLTDLGLIESKDNQRNRIFVITDKGIQFFQQLREFIENMHGIKIRF